MSLCFRHYRFSTKPRVRLLCRRRFDARGGARLLEAAAGVSAGEQSHAAWPWSPIRPARALRPSNPSTSKRERHENASECKTDPLGCGWWSSRAWTDRVLMGWVEDSCIGPRHDGEQLSESGHSCIDAVLCRKVSTSDRCPGCTR